MSAEVLRRAASLMRERAEAATNGSWFADGFTIRGGPEGRAIASAHNAEHVNARHIASWHPAVALAVAESVDVALGWFDPEDCTEAEQAMHDALLTVARAYLGDSS